MGVSRDGGGYKVWSVGSWIRGDRFGDRGVALSEEGVGCSGLGGDGGCGAGVCVFRFCSRLVWLRWALTGAAFFSGSCRFGPVSGGSVKFVSGSKGFG